MTHVEKKPPVVVLKGVEKHFDGKAVLAGLDLTIEDGEFFTILGPSGCGKTTALRLIAGLENADAGIVEIAGIDNTALPAEKRNVNTVFQSYALFPHMTVFDNVAFGLKMQKVAAGDIQSRVMDALKMVQLDSFAKRKPHQLSGGQQQRVAIARAVVNKPKVLLLDESLSALDFKLRKAMQWELKQLQRSLGITFIFVTHDQEEALSMSDRILVMNNGRAEQLGTPREIYETPQSLFVARFIGEINIFDAEVVGHDGTHLDVTILGKPFKVNGKDSFAPGQKVKVMLRPEDLRLDAVSSEQGLAGRVVERTYKGATLDSLVELADGNRIQVSEFFDEDDPDFDHSLNEMVVVSWVPQWEVVLADE
ncbi:spermidine/putrescine ABC transporter ATP-binding protein PotA [Gallaecimonas pentaromativorans]|uniref:spermidine/putrescine ABC transporter ATP-binding protein PotA n=1 Tax=Gallaecimonas pentaromativorans TaxID=584787 RepID=UPI00067F3658|nr:spermidine/putrescine ABC transporter ATP-binding protein PotA [Gallaecimonas pentaromativorans]MED5525441.1 spermidine/putrescine ABC transporter ATP-binding protein PotA [Pseudomonadota bacterium]